MGMQLFVKNELTPSADIGGWNEMYKYLYTANVVIDGVESSSLISASKRNQLIGEAKFMRAFLFFYLTNLYGDVPLVISSDYRINNVISKTPQNKVYDPD